MSLRNGWDFHSDIAQELESIAREHFGFNFAPHIISHSIPIFNADDIEKGTFAQVMVLLLMDKYKQSLYKNENMFKQIEDFIDNCGEYYCNSGNEIDKEIANDFITEFTRLYNLYKIGDDAYYI